MLIKHELHERNANLQKIKQTDKAIKRAASMSSWNIEKLYCSNNKVLARFFKLHVNLVAPVKHCLSNFALIDYSEQVAAVVVVFVVAAVAIAVAFAVAFAAIPSKAVDTTGCGCNFY